TESDHFGNAADPGCHSRFGLSRNGETVYLHSGLEGVLTGYSIDEKFDASEAGVTLGRYRKSTGAYNFVALSAPTPGSVNAAPAVGPVVISEIMYNPVDQADAEYVELLNISETAVTLYDEATGVPWRFTDDPDDPSIQLSFPTDEPVILAPGEYLLLVRNRMAFDLAYSAPAGVPILEWGTGKLANGREKIQLSKPAPGADADGPWIRVDRVVYSDGANGQDFPTGVDPWPTEPDGQGAALGRLDPTTYGNDPAHWQAITPTPGTAN
ncbi:MAG: lamin tail domain-containing protein, partial [Phycisphaerales bacterium]